ncbi:MAG: WD40 repeat domain-containing protein [Cyclobacteriaceae bacterium]|nr:WD40 repeat domain-containing protein [Cyclobacteriaceae bacterium]
MGKIQVNKLNTFSGHQDAIYTLEPGANSWEFYSGAGDGMVVAWNLQEPDAGKLIVNLPTSVYALEYLPEGHRLLVGQNYQGIHLADLESNREIGSLKLTEAAVFDIKYHDGFAYVGSGDGTLHVVHLDSLSVVKQLKFSDKSVRCIAINPHNEQIAVGYSDHFIRIFSTDEHQLIQEFQAHQNSVFSLAYHPQKPLLLSASRDAHLKVWSAEQPYELHHSIVAHMYAINHIEFSPSGHHFVTCSMDKSIKVWSSEQFQLLKVIDKARYAGHGTSVNKLYWSAYLSQLASCSDDRTISIWDIKL